MGGDCNLRAGLKARVPGLRSGVGTGPVTMAYRSRRYSQREARIGETLATYMELAGEKRFPVLSGLRFSPLWVTRTQEALIRFPSAIGLQLKWEL